MEKMVCYGLAFFLLISVFSMTMVAANAETLMLQDFSTYEDMCPAEKTCG